MSREIESYDLDVILALGFRLRSPVAVRFRQWAFEKLKEYIVKGFVLDDERLKCTDRITHYFDDLLARIREIRASEQRVCQRIREIFALVSDDGEGEIETQKFFATMQNKMQFAATALVCANCHRMLHHRPFLSVEALLQIVDARGARQQP